MMTALMAGDDKCPHGGSWCVPLWQLMISALMAAHCCVPSWQKCALMDVFVCCHDDQTIVMCIVMMCVVMVTIAYDDLCRCLFGVYCLLGLCFLLSSDVTLQGL